MKTSFISLLLLLCVILPLSAQEQKPPASAASGGGGAPVEPNYRLIGSVSGTKLLEQSGRMALEDPRTVFYSPADKEIIVYFTWEGPPGQHHFEGLWKNPAGKVIMTSEFDYKPDQRRFGGYFKMLTGDTPATGVWTIEARIDGESAGSHAFQITTTARPEGATNSLTRRMLSPSEIYNRAAAASVLVQNINARGVRRSVGTGFFIGPGQLLTTFQVIDGAARVRVDVPLNQLTEVTEVVAYNRRQNWVILKLPFDMMPVLKRSAPGSWSIGDRNYFLDVPREGNRVLVETMINGKQTISGMGERLNIANSINQRAVGSPLMNDFGEVIGMIGGSLLPGAVAIPIELISDAGATATTVDGLLKAGQFTPALVSTASVLNGGLARTINKKTDPPQLIDEKIEFSGASPDAVLLITWLPKEKRKGYPSVRIYDIDNQMLSETVNKKKITVTPNKLSYSLWELNFAKLQPGIYRVDVLLDGDFVWRGFFRMVD
jgi:trypsin-like peptidase